MIIRQSPERSTGAIRIDRFLPAVQCAPFGARQVPVLKDQMVKLPIMPEKDKESIYILSFWCWRFPIFAYRLIDAERNFNLQSFANCQIYCVSISFFLTSFAHKVWRQYEYDFPGSSAALRRCQIRNCANLFPLALRAAPIPIRYDWLWLTGQTKRLKNGFHVYIRLSEARPLCKWVEAVKHA